MSVRVKICGITRVEDAEAALEAGADALGFMFVRPSPRWIAFAEAAVIRTALPRPPSCVGVFVNPPFEEVGQAVAVAGIDTLQFHGEETPEFCRRFGAPPAERPGDSESVDLFAGPQSRPPTDPLRIVKAFRIRDADSLASLPEFETHGWLLDSFVPGQHGGTGARFNWDLARAAKRWDRPIVLAGGLTPDNVAEAVRQVRPYAVDVSSGVEAAPGKKDPVKLRDFIQAAKSA